MYPGRAAPQPIPQTVDLRTPALARAWAIRFGLSVDEMHLAVRSAGRTVQSIEQYLRDVMRRERARLRCDSARTGP